MKATQETTALDNDRLPLIPPGQYVATFVGCERQQSPWGPKLRLDFVLVSSVPTGEVVKGADGDAVVLSRYLNLPKQGAKPSRHSALMVEFAAMLNRLPGENFVEAFESVVGNTFLVDVKTVETRPDKNPLPKVLHYSKIGAIIESVAQDAAADEPRPKINGKDSPAAPFSCN
jgi:hypothetical protein